MRYRVNRRTFKQFLEVQVQKLGSERKAAMRAGVSHTLIQSLRTGRETTKDGRRLPKTHVNLVTARKIESAWGIPEEVCFFPETLDGRSSVEAA